MPRADVAAGCGCAQVLGRFLFERATEMGMETGGAEDGSHVCLLFDTIQTVEEASAYLGAFLDGLVNGVAVTIHIHFHPTPFAFLA